MTLPDGMNKREYLKFTEVDGEVAIRTTATLETGDIEIGAVEIKDATSDNRVTVDDTGALKVTGGASTPDADYKVGGTFGTTTTVTHNTLPYTPVNTQIKYIQVSPATGDSFLLSNASNGVTMAVSSNVITVSGASDDFASGDSYEIGFSATYEQKQTIDSDTNTQLTTQQNPDYGHSTSVEHPVDETNQAAGSYRTIIQADTYPSMSLHLKGSGGVTFTVWASNDETADASADTGWVDISSTVMGVASLVDSEGIYFIDTKMIVDRYMIKHVCSDSGNASDIFIKRGY